MKLESLGSLNVGSCAMQAGIHFQYSMLFLPSIVHRPSHACSRVPYIRIYNLLLYIVVYVFYTCSNRFVPVRFCHRPSHTVRRKPTLKMKPDVKLLTIPHTSKHCMDNSEKNDAHKLCRHLNNLDYQQIKYKIQKNGILSVICSVI